MVERSFRGKPTESHIIWTRETRDGTAKKRFDRQRFERWASHCGFDFEKEVRVDHDRADEPREQYRCVFAWGTVEGETIELGDEKWSMGEQRTPRTFVEVDGQGTARVKGWSFERTLDIVELRHEGPELVLETAGGDRKRLDAQAFADESRGRGRERD